MWLLSTRNLIRSKRSLYNLRSLLGLHVTVGKTIILQILVSCFWNYIAGRIAKLKEAQFADGFLRGEDHRVISQITVKQVHVLKIDELNNLSYYQEMKIKFETWYVYKSFYICIMTGYSSSSMRVFCYLPAFYSLCSAPVHRSCCTEFSVYCTGSFQGVEGLLDYWAVTQYNNWKFVSGLYWRRHHGMKIRMITWNLWF
jgi:hypothetical protein